MFGAYPISFLAKRRDIYYAYSLIVGGKKYAYL
jgi:hypothetical protein